MTVTTDRELIDKAKRMCLTMKGFRMGMPEVKGHQPVTISVESLERLTALAILGLAVFEADRAGHQGYMGPRSLDKLISDWTENTNLLVGQVTDTKTGEIS